MAPKSPLPISEEWNSPEEYTNSLINLVTSSELLRTLCGGVHVLDFFTRTPDLYSAILPQEWRDFFREHDIMPILDLFMRDDLTQINGDTWKNGPAPPEDLVRYISDIRRHSLKREFHPIGDGKKRQIDRDIARGMNVKKVHEVDHFSRYVGRLTEDIAASRNEPITHLVDFGAGQGYLPRCLASPPYNRHIVALESKQLNIEGAMNWDVMAKLAEKPKVMRNKKEWRAERDAAKENGDWKSPGKKLPDVKGSRGYFFHPGTPNRQPDPAQAKLQISNLGQGSIQYVEHWIWDGDLTRVVDQIIDQDAVRQNLRTALPEAKEDEVEEAFAAGDLQIRDQPKLLDPKLMVISLHSCGNLVHHGIRSLLMNPSVSAVALVGCCYNLLTERLGAPTYKLPSLRTANARLEETSKSCDPHGFPMSERLCTYPTSTGSGVRLNITARMMAVQAPQNWGEKDSEDFFRRHFFRALLQKVFLDLGVVSSPTDEDEVGDRSPLAWTGGTTPIILGSLRRAAYTDFVSYVRAAQAKLVQDEDKERGKMFEEKLGSLTDEDIDGYAERYKERKKELSVVWSLMAFSAGVIEATIVVDRWLFLKEQAEIKDAWVETVFDFSMSPRNLVVVGIKK